MNPYKLVIFDLDGTLADTSIGIFKSIRYVQKMMRLPEISEEQMRSHVGPPMEESYNRNFGLTGEKLKEAVKLHKDYAMKQGFMELEFYKGIPELLDALKKKGIKTAVATLKSHNTAIKIFQTFHMEDRFHIVKGIDSNNPMTKSQIIEFCMEKSGCKQSETVLIGDSCYDALGAFQSGIDFIAVTYGFGFKNQKDVQNYQHCAICNTVSDLSEYLC